MKTETKPAIGQRVQLRTAGRTLVFDCIVCDVKTEWGKVRLLVEPVVGSGQQWVDLSSVSLPMDKYIAAGKHVCGLGGEVDYPNEGQA